MDRHYTKVKQMANQHEQDTQHHWPLGKCKLRPQ